MIEVWYTRIRQVPTYLWNEHIHYLPETMKNQLQRIQNKKKQSNYLLGRLLLEKVLSAFSNNLHQISYSEQGRPYISGEVDFNLSHSGEYIVCVASSTLRVGIDIEHIKPRSHSQIEAALTACEWTLIRTSPDILTSFYKLWTQKEAVSKAEGGGLRLLKSIKVKDCQAILYSSQWYLEEIRLDSRYIIHLATDQPLKLEAISPTEFLVEYV